MWVPSLTGGLLLLASEVFLVSKPRVTHDHILQHRIQNFPNLEGRSQYLYIPGREWPNYTPRNRVPSSLSSTTRRVTVDVFEPTTTCESCNPLVEVELRLTVSQSVSMSWYRAPLWDLRKILLPVGMFLSVSVGRPLWREEGSAICIAIIQSS
jgi:hypothetical protein